jgi:hypothetical protein
LQLETTVSIDVGNMNKHLLLNPGMDRLVLASHHGLIIAQDESAIDLVKNFDVENHLVVNSIAPVASQDNLYIDRCVFQIRGN